MALHFQHSSSTASVSSSSVSATSSSPAWTPLHGARSCPACDAPEGLPQGEKNGFALLACKSCATVYASRLPEQIGSADYDRFYTEEHLATATPAFLDSRLDEIVAGFARYREHNRLLDVGFGSGSLLRAAARAGWQAEGIELSKTAVLRARQMGLSASCGDLLSAHHPTGSFDVVTASELLEHLSAPGQMLAEIARILRPAGLLWATTPHARGLSARLLRLKWSVVGPPEHLQLFSRRGIQVLLSRSGFQRVSTRFHGLNPFEILYHLRRGEEAAEELFGRVRSGQELNGFFREGPLRRRFKSLANQLLSATQLGDTIKIWAER